MYQVVKVKALPNKIPQEVIDNINREPFVEVSCRYIEDSLPLWLDQVAILCHQAKTLYILDIFLETEINGSIKFNSSFIYQTLNAVQPLIRMGFEFLQPPKDPFILADMMQINIGLSTPLNHLTMDLLSRAEVQAFYDLLPQEFLQDEENLYATLTPLVRTTYITLEAAYLATSQDPEIQEIRASNLEDQFKASFLLQKTTAYGILVDPQALEQSIVEMELQHNATEVSIGSEFKAVLWPNQSPDQQPSLF